MSLLELWLETWLIDVWFRIDRIGSITPYDPIASQRCFLRASQVMRSVSSYLTSLLPTLIHAGPISISLQSDNVFSEQPK